MKMKLDNRGFSLAEIMVAAGMLGVLTLGVTSLMTNMKKGEVETETKMEELELRRLITTTLTDQAACNNTLSGISIGSSLSQIKNSAGTAVYSTGITYGNNSIKITDMKTQDLGIVNANGTRTINLNITMQKMKKMLAQNSKTTSIKLNVSAPSASGVIANCDVATNQIVKDSMMASCTSLNGTWNDVAGSCTIDYFVNKTGDTMTGPLQTTNVTSPLFCTGANCKAIGDLALANQNCSNKNEVQIGVNTNGTPKCLPITCGANQYFSGIDSVSGTIICKTIPSKDCGTGAYVSLVNPDGSIVCSSSPPSWDADCGVGKVLQRVTSDGVKICVNKGGNKTCNAGDFVSAVSADGTVICTTSLKAPPVCMGSNILNWNGSTWSCNPAPVGTPAAPYRRSGSCGATCSFSGRDSNGGFRTYSCTTTLTGDGAYVYTPTSTLTGTCSKSYSGWCGSVDNGHPCGQTGACAASCTLNNQPN